MAMRRVATIVLLLLIVATLWLATTCGGEEPSAPGQGGVRGTSEQTPPDEGSTSSAAVARSRAAPTDPAAVRADAFQGRVTDEDGNPMTGARVTLHARDPLERVDARVVLADFDRALAATATDDDGRFVLPAEADVRRVVLASKDSFVPAAILASRGGTADLTLRRGREVRLRVVDVAGGPIEGATVHVQNRESLAGDLGAPAGRTDAEGRLRVLAAEWSNLFLRAAGFETEREVVLGGSGDEGERTVVLEDGGEVAGIVVDGSGAPLSGVRVREDSWGDDPDDFSESSVVTDRDGAFRLEGLDAGEVDLYVVSRDRALRGVVWTSTGRTDLRIVLRRVGTVRGTVVDDDGNPAKDALVGVWGEPPERADEAGRFEVRADPGRRLLRAEWRDGDHLGERTVDVPGGETVEDVRIVVAPRERPSRIRVRVATPPGADRAWVWLTAFHGPDEIGSAPAWTGEDEILDCDVPPGTSVGVVAVAEDELGDESVAVAGTAQTCAPDAPGSGPVVLLLGPRPRVRFRIEDPEGRVLSRQDAEFDFSEPERVSPVEGPEPVWSLDPVVTLGVWIDVAGHALQRVGLDPPHPSVREVTVRLARAATVVGRLAESDGRAPTEEHREVWVRIPAGDGAWTRDQQVGADGRFRLERLVAGAGELIVFESPHGFRLHRTIRTTPGETTDLGEVSLPPLAAVEGIVTDELGRGIGGVHIVRTDTAAPPYGRGVTTGPDGAFREVLPQRPGLGFLALRAGFGASVTPFEVDGPRPVRIVLRPGGRVRLTFPAGSRPNPWIFARPAGTKDSWPILPSLRTESDDGRTVTVDGLPPGPVELSGSGLGHDRSVTVTVVAGETVEVRL